MPGRIIKLTQNGREKKVMKVSRLNFFIGRDIYCDLRIINKDVSPQHCLITALKDKPALIRNLSRNNPTLVNEREIGSKDVELQHEDIISINRHHRYIWKYDSLLEEDGVAGESVEVAENRSWSLYRNKLVAVVTAHRTEKTEDGEQPAVKKKRKTWPAGVDEMKETQPGSLHRKLTRVIGLKGGVRSARTSEQKGRSSGQRKGVLSSLSKGKTGTSDIGGRKSVKFADTTPINRSSRTSPLQRSGLKKCISSLTPYRGPKLTPSKKESVYFTPPSRSGGGAAARLPQDQLSSPPEVSIGTARNSISASGRKTAAPQVVMRSHRKCTPAGNAVAASSFTTPKSISKVSLKRQTEASSIEASRRAAKKLKAEPPHAIDEKKKAAILMCHRKSLTPHPGVVTVRKPLFRQVLKKNLSASFKKLKSPKKSASIPVASPIVLTTVVPKQFNFQPKDRDGGEETSTSVYPKKSLTLNRSSSTNRSMRRRSTGGRVLRATAADWRLSETTTQRGDHVDLLSALDLSRKTPSASVSPNSDTTITDGIRQLFATDKTWDAKGVRELFLEADNNTLAEESTTTDECSSVLIEENIANKSRRSSVLKGKQRTSSATAEQSNDHCDSILSKSIHSFYIEGVEPSPLPEDSAALNSLQNNTAATSRRSTLKGENISINDFVTSTPLRTRSDLQLSELEKASNTKQKSISLSENSIGSSFKSADSTVATLRSGRSSVLTSKRSVSFLEVSRKSRSSPKYAEKTHEREDTTSSLHLSVISKPTDTTPKPRGRPSKQRRSSSTLNIKDIENKSRVIDSTSTSLLRSERGSAVIFNKSVSFAENSIEESLSGDSRKSRISQKLAEKAVISSSSNNTTVSLHLSAIENVTPKPRGRLSKQTKSLSASNIKNIAGDSTFLIGSARTSLRSERSSTIVLDKSSSFTQASSEESQSDVSRKSRMSAKNKGSSSSLESSHFTSTEDVPDTPKPRGRPSKQHRSSTISLDKSASFVQISSKESQDEVSSMKSPVSAKKMGSSSSLESSHFSATEDAVASKPRGKPSQQRRSSSALNIKDIENKSSVLDTRTSLLSSDRGSGIIFNKSVSFAENSNEESCGVSRKSRNSQKLAEKAGTSSSPNNTPVSLHLSAIENVTPKPRGKSSKQTRSSSASNIKDIANASPFLVGSASRLSYGRGSTLALDKSSSFVQASSKESQGEVSRKSPMSAKTGSSSSLEFSHVTSTEDVVHTPKPIGRPSKQTRSSSASNIKNIADDSSLLVGSARTSLRSGRGSTISLDKPSSFAQASRKSPMSANKLESSHFTSTEDVAHAPKPRGRPSKETRPSGVLNITEVVNQLPSFVSTRVSLRSGRETMADVSKKQSLLDISQNKSLKLDEKAMKSPEKASISLLHLSAMEKVKETPKPSKQRRSWSTPNILEVVNETSALVDFMRPSLRRGRSSAIVSRSVSFADKSTVGSSRDSPSVSRKSLKAVEKTDLENTSLSLHFSVIEKATDTLRSSKKTRDTSRKSGKPTEKTEISLSPEYTSLSLHLSAKDTPKRRGRSSKMSTSLSVPCDKDTNESSFLDSTRTSSRGRGSTVEVLNKYTSGESEKLQKSDVSLSPGNTSWSLHLSSLLSPRLSGKPSKQTKSLSEPNIKDAVNESFRRILRSSQGSTVPIKRSVSFVEDTLPGKMLSYTEMRSISPPLHRNSVQIYSSTPIVKNNSSMRPQDRSETPDRLQNSLKFSSSSAKPRGRPSKILRSVSIPNIDEVSNENISETSLKRTSVSSSNLLVKISPGGGESLPGVLSPVITVMSEAELLPKNLTSSSDTFRTPRTRGREKLSTSALIDKRKSTKFGSLNINRSRKSMKKMAKENRSVSFSSFHLVIGENGNGGVSLQELSPSKQRETSIGKPALTSTPYPSRKRKLSKFNETVSPWESKRQRKAQLLSSTDGQISEPSSGLSTPELVNSSQVIPLSSRKKSLRLKVEHESKSLVFSVHEGSSPLSILSPKDRPSMRHKMDRGSGAECDFSNFSIANFKTPTVSLSRLPEDFLSTSRRSIKQLLDRCSVGNLGTSSAKVTPSSEKVEQVSSLTEETAETSLTVQEKDTSLSEEMDSFKTSVSASSRTNFSKSRLSRSSSSPQLTKSLTKESLENLSTSPKGKHSKLSSEGNRKTPKSVATSSKSKLTISPQKFFGISPLQTRNIIENEGFKTPNSVDSSRYRLHSVSMNRRSKSFISAKTPMTFGDNETSKTILASRSVSKTSTSSKCSALSYSKIAIVDNSETPRTSLASRSRLSENKFLPKSLTKVTCTSLALRDPQTPEAASTDETPKTSPAPKSRVSEHRYRSLTRITTPRTSLSATSETPKILLVSGAFSKSVLKNRRSKSFTSVNISPRLSNSSKTFVSLHPDETRKSATNVNVSKRKLVESGSFSISPPVKKKKSVSKMESVSVIAEAEANDSSPARKIVVAEDHEPTETTAQKTRLRRGRSENKTVTAENLEGVSTVNSRGRQNQQVSDVLAMVKLKTEKPAKKTRGKTNHIDSTVELTKMLLLTKSEESKKTIEPSGNRTTRQRILSETAEVMSTEGRNVEVERSKKEESKGVASESAGRSTRGKGKSGSYKEQEGSFKPQTQAKRQNQEAKEEVSVRKTRGRKVQAEQSTEESERTLRSMRRKNASQDTGQEDKSVTSKLKGEKQSSEVEDDQKGIVKSIPDVYRRMRAERRQGEEPSSRKTRGRKGEMEADIVTVQVEEIAGMLLPKNARKLKGSSESSLPPSLARAHRSCAVKEVTLPLKEQKAKEEECLFAESSKNVQKGQSLEDTKARQGRNEVDVSIKKNEMEEGPNSRRRGRSKKVEESRTKEIPRKVEDVESPSLKKTRGRKKKEDVELVKEELSSKTRRQKVNESTSKEVELPRVQRTRNGRVEKVKDQVSPKISPLKKTRGKRVLKNETMEFVQTKKVGRTKKTEDTMKAVEPTKSVEEPTSPRSGRQKKVLRTAKEAEITDPVSNKKTRGRKNIMSEQEKQPSGSGRRKVEPRIQEVEGSPVQKKKTGKMKVAKEEKSPNMSALKKTRGQKDDDLVKKELLTRSGRRKLEEYSTVGDSSRFPPVQRTEKEKLEVAKDEFLSKMSPLKKTRGRKNETLLEEKELASRRGRRKVEESQVERVPVQRTKKGRVTKVKEAVSPQVKKTTEGRQPKANKRKSILSVKTERNKSVAKSIKARLSVRRSSIAPLGETKRKRVDFNL